MKIRIKGTEKIEELVIRDEKGIEFTNDLLQFQFLIGTLQTELVILENYIPLEFQFLIGTLQTFTRRRNGKRKG